MLGKYKNPCSVEASTLTTATAVKYFSAEPDRITGFVVHLSCTAVLQSKHPIRAPGVKSLSG